MNPAAGIDFFIKGGSIRDAMMAKWSLVFAMLILVFSGLKILLNYQFKYSLVALIVPFLILSMFLLYKTDYINWKKRNYVVSNDYLDAQLWAKENTPFDSLFMVDPSLFYGWRDFSQRSSFGNFREWVWFPVAYVVDVAVLNEGKKRAKEFGVDIDSIIKSDSVNYVDGYSKIVDDLRKKYYSMDDEQAFILKNRYKIDYFIMNKLQQKNRFNYPVAYENNTFIIYGNIQINSTL
jgi:hypothetical protein